MTGAIVFLSACCLPVFAGDGYRPASLEELRSRAAEEAYFSESPAILNALVKAGGARWPFCITWRPWGIRIASKSFAACAISSPTIHFSSGIRGLSKRPMASFPVDEPSDSSLCHNPAAYAARLADA